MSILSLQNVEYQYQGTKKNVLKNISAEFLSGTLYAIMGKSGAGKSTMLSVLAGLDIPTKGKLLYKGIDICETDRDRFRAKDIGVIFQGYNLLLNATATENIVLSMNISECKTKSKKVAAYKLLEQVGIDKESANRKVLKLSGGEQQRVGIARAIAHDPDIIIADEPTGNLDQETEKTIMSILTGLAHDMGKCVIVVTHSKSVAEYADVLLRLNNGSLINSMS